MKISRVRLNLLPISLNYKRNLIDFVLEFDIYVFLTKITQMDMLIFRWNAQIGVLPRVL